MSTQNLSTLAIGVVEQYHAAGKNLVLAYRAGTERAIGAVNARFESAVNMPRLRVSEPMKASVIEAQRHVADFVAFGLGLPANGADATIDQLSRRVANGIERVSSATSKVENAFGAQALDKAGSLVLPVARVSLAVASAVAQRTSQLSERVAGAQESVAAQPVKAARKTSAKKPARKAVTRRASAA
jgi:hypothetical protein